MKMKTHLAEPMGYSKGSAKQKLYSYECIYQKQTNKLKRKDSK
jgi:hypothetical protein